MLDALTYAGNLANLEPVRKRPELGFVQGNICDTPLVERLLREQRIDTIVHFAAESHVDRSIHGPDAFIETNVQGTHSMLKAARKVWLEERTVPAHRFHHVSTDEVYGSLGAGRSCIPRANPVRAELAVLGQQGGVRSPGPGLPPYLWPRGHDQQLLEQLRPVPFSREADPADDRQPAARPAVADLRRWPQCQGLAARERSLPRHRSHHAKGQAGRGLQYRRWGGERESEARRDTLRDSG